MNRKFNDSSESSYQVNGATVDNNINDDITLSSLSKSSILAYIEKDSEIAAQSTPVSRIPHKSSRSKKFRPFSRRMTSSDNKRKSFWRSTAKTEEDDKKPLENDDKNTFKKKPTTRTSIKVF